MNHCLALIILLLSVGCFGQECKDQLPLGCPNVYDYCTSHKHFVYLKENCQLTCQQCQNDCKDFVACRSVKQIGGCDETTRYDHDIVMRWCPRTCESCNDKARVPKKTAATSAQIARVLKALDDLLKDAKEGWEGKMPHLEKELDDALKGKDPDDKECAETMDPHFKVTLDISEFTELAKNKGDWKLDHTFCANGIQFRVIPKYEACADPDGCLAMNTVASYAKTNSWTATVRMEFIIFNTDDTKNIVRKMGEVLTQAKTSKDTGSLEKFSVLTDPSKGFLRPDKQLTFSVEINILDFRKT